MLISKESSAVNLIGAWNDREIRVGEEWIGGHVIVSPNAIIRNWTVDSPAELAVTDLHDALALQPEIVIIGTGEALVLPMSDIVGTLGRQGIGVEVMNTPAACRTYNVLAHELRRVVAALFEPVTRRDSR